ncbi:MAG: radical SAM protein [bacterium]
MQSPNIYNKAFILHETQSKHEGFLPPLSLMSVAAGAQKYGHEVKIIDASIKGLGPESIVREAAEWGAETLGFSLFSSNFCEHIKYIKRVKELSGLKVIVGGKHASYYPRETLSHAEIDYGVIGEGDITIGELLDSIEGKRSLESVDGIIFRNGGELAETKPRALVRDLDTLPFPARGLLNSNDYYSMVSPLKNVTLSMVSRGCPFHCIFCAVGQTEFRRRSKENVIEEIRICRDEFGVRLIDFQDSTFNVNLDFTKELCSEIAKSDTGIKFMARVRANKVDAELVRLLKEAGFFFVMIGIESGDPQILKRIRKDITLDDVRRSVSMFNKAGISVMGYFVLGLPGDTRETVMNTISFSTSVGLSYAQFTKLLPMPHSDIYVEMMNRTGKDAWSEHTVNPNADLSLPLLDTDLAPEEIEELLNLAFKRFYLRFAFITRRILELRNLSEFIKYAKAALSLISTLFKK